MSVTKIRIDLAVGPNPPWTNLYFDCECGARYQLGAADECELVDGTPNGYYAPPCWTCDRVNVVTIPTRRAPVARPTA